MFPYIKNAQENGCGKKNNCLPRSQPLRVASEKCLLTIDFLLLQAVSPLRLILSPANLSDYKQSLKAFSSISAAAYRRQKKSGIVLPSIVFVPKKRTPREVTLFGVMSRAGNASHCAGAHCGVVIYPISRII